MQKFWTSLWSTEKEFNEVAEWLKREEERCEGLEQQEWEEIKEVEFMEALRKAQKWKLPGIDKVLNIWLNTLDSIHESITNCYNRAITNPETNLQWFIQGITYLLPKSIETDIPKNYRTITCLPTMYKILTSIVTERTCNLLDTNNILPSEQEGCKKGSYGCKDQLLINKMLLENSRTCHRNLSIAWIDYRKASNSVLHTSILKVLQIYKISPTIINFLTVSMKKWKTNLYLNHAQGSTVCKGINIKCGIFQGDSFPPRLFCLALVPLAYELNKTGFGYNIYEEKINHLFYMDDSKLCGKNDYELEGLLRTVKTFSDDIDHDRVAKFMH